MNRTPLRQMSPRRRKQMKARRVVVDLVRVRDVSCKASHVWPDIECAGPLDCHEIIPRSVWASGYRDPTNVILVCRTHHDLIGDHPGLAHDSGLHGFSYERGDR